MDAMKSSASKVDEEHHSEALSNGTGESSSNPKRPLDGNHSISKRTKHNPDMPKQEAWDEVTNEAPPTSIDTSSFVFDELDFRGILILRESLRLANLSRLGQSNEEEQKLQLENKIRKATENSSTVNVHKSVDAADQSCPPSITASRYFLRKLQSLARLSMDKVHLAPDEISSFDSPSLVCKDLSDGQEAVPILVTNMYDDPPVGPVGFKYIKTLEVASNVEAPPRASGCKCKGDCRKCSCARLNGDFPYASQNKFAKLIEPRDIVFECGPSCGCGPNCKNRVSQKGLQYKLEVYRTVKKGWAVKTLDFIPSGALVMEYIGVLRKTKELDADSANEYIFEIDCLQTINEVEERERRFRHVSLPANICVKKSDDQEEAMENVPEFCIDAGSVGNVARFINHSCEPNLFVQCVLSSYSDIRLARIVLFAGDDIQPFQELTYDYNFQLDSIVGPDKQIKQLACHCGEATCRKRLY